MKYTIISIFIATLFIATASDARLYKWIDENGKTHFSDKPPGPDKTPENIKEYNSFEEVAPDEEMAMPDGPAASKIKVLKVKTKIFRIVSHDSDSSGTIGSGSSSSSSGDNYSRTAYSLAVMAKVKPINDFSGYVRISLQAMDRDGAQVTQALIAGYVGPDKEITLSQKTQMMKSVYKRIHEWRIADVYIKKRK